MEVGLLTLHCIRSAGSKLALADNEIGAFHLETALVGYPQVTWTTWQPNWE